jgi:hypothetical protein
MQFINPLAERVKLFKPGLIGLSLARSMQINTRKSISQSLKLFLEQLILGNRMVLKIGKESSIFQVDVTYLWPFQMKIPEVLKMPQHMGGNLVIGHRYDVIISENILAQINILR